MSSPTDLVFQPHEWRMVHFGIVFSAESDLIGAPQILHENLDLRIGTAEDHEKVITDFQEYTLMLVNNTTEEGHTRYTELSGEAVHHH